MSASRFFKARCLYVAIFSIIASSADAAEFAGGTGEPNNPYQIATAEQLISIGSDPNLLDKHYVLINDIDLDLNLPGGQVFTKAVIASELTLNNPEVFGGTPFSGCFDGQGYVISNLHIQGDRYLGLFGYLKSGAVIANLGLETIDVNGTGNYIGGLVGYNYDGDIDTCYSTGAVDGGSGVGGLVGLNSGSVSSSYSTSIVSGEWSDVGGLVGWSWRGEIVNCHASGQVSGQSDIGGLVGHLQHSTITGCGASSSVSGNRRLGGLVGYGTTGTVHNSYATGSVSGGDGAEDLGGIAGVIYDSNITNCYAIGSVSAGLKANNLGGIVGYNTSEVVYCYSTSTVSGGDMCMDLGGLAGLNSSGHVSNCYAIGNVYGGNDSNNLGGLVGRNGNITGGQDGGGRGSAEIIHTGHITNCYSAGRVYGGDNSTFVGGLVGDNFEGTINNCFWDIEVSGLSESAGGTGLNTAQMQTAATFRDANWDFVDETDNGTDDIWKMPPWTGYPLLAWQEVEMPAPAPIAYWAFDEGSGDIATDSAGDNHGTIYNPEWAEGKINGALQFNGFTTYVDCGDSEVLGPEQMTLALWLEPGHMGGMRYILSRAKESSDDIDYALTRLLTGQVEFTVGQLNTASVSVLSSSTTPLDEWSHVAVGMDGSKLSVYINGQLDASANYSERGPRQAHRLVLSSYQGSTRFYFGKLDDVRIYDTALSEYNIEALYTDGSQ